MNQNILHVGLDVDDTQYHGSAFNRKKGEKGSDPKMGSDPIIFSWPDFGKA
jgi:hypothetical protein